MTTATRSATGRAIGSLHRLALRVFPRLPAPVRRGAVRLLTPQHTVGAVCVVQHEDDVLVLRQLHRAGHTLPGGLLNRGETAAEAVVREVREETGLRIAVDQPLAVVVAPRVRRVDVVYRVVAHARPEVRPAGEAVGAEWVPMDSVELADSSTRDIVGVVRAALADDVRTGRLLG